MTWICCKFNGEYDSEKFENRLTFVKPANECTVAQFLLRHGVHVDRVTPMFRRVKIESFTSYRLLGSYIPADRLEMCRRSSSCWNVDSHIFCHASLPILSTDITSSFILLLTALKHLRKINLFA